ncbi:uncharacterized protein KGF55_004946 [Candida pseudojiufengensis]|uniref:uncharacterized protein n=1 Tax=Candida pseudojiufengensis TaxID=497109 RepID=UPI002224B2CE|nr:uncharacterized protein KGF55_004946 [Candida pseudojiufengensis]KAI5959714.1 hypothetical protein KGF55_004946 [Candida pseudojiufengensis]
MDSFTDLYLFGDGDEPYSPYDKRKMMLQFFKQLQQPNLEPLWFVHYWEELQEFLSDYHKSEQDALIFIAMLDLAKSPIPDLFFKQPYFEIDIDQVKEFTAKNDPEYWEQ